MKQPIIILGFGRSGTTWISDIVSKALGGLVLFEPLHPSVTDSSERLSYRPVTEDAACELKPYFDEVLTKRQRKMWLMRNHVPVPLKDIDPVFLDTLWDECAVIGFKEIRCNLMLPWLVENYGRKIVFVIRDPRAVTASILRRKNFWEFGWPGTFNAFLAATLDNSDVARLLPKEGINRARLAANDIERIGAMWAITHAIILPQLKQLGISFFLYEDFYEQPFRTARRMFEQLGYGEVPLHPAHLLTPSMTTAKTVHGLYDFDRKIEKHDLSFFWSDTLGASDLAQLQSVLSAFDLPVELDEKWGVIL
ncbi:MAG: sulfotransferase domain-containing protein [Alphaproteobacteria bacterium]|nr:sulfotransferase domain-containing protein [Alphaproteobacteria bacterium]